jgi:hypothetical protein
MALHFEAVREKMVDNAIGYVDLQGWQAVGADTASIMGFKNSRASVDLSS